MSKCLIRNIYMLTMKRSNYLLALPLLAFIALAGCSQLNFPTDLSILQQGKGLSTAEVVQGLKEALTLGAEKSANSASQTDGFYKNVQLFIPFPPEAIKVKNTLEKVGLNKPINDFVMSLNRAAEDASKRAFPIFKSAIISMTISDAMGILKGSNNAATDFLRSKTYSQLKDEFKPIVRQSISTVKVTNYWNPVATNYNRLTMLTGGGQVNPNLEEYITEKAIDGLFKLVANEEVLIRKDPAARVTEILKKVFAQQ